MAELQLPEKFGQYVDIEVAIKEANETYDTQGVSDMYSTGIKMLDEYFSGGYGRKNSYELVLVASAPKCYKTTFAMQMLVEPLKKKVPMLWVLAEMSYGETVNMLRAFFYPKIEEADKILRESYKAGALKIVDKDTIDGVKDISQLEKMLEVAGTEGCELFYIDPLNYLTRQATESQDKQNRAESEIMKWFKRYLEKNKKTALLVMHNTKDPNQHRQEGLAGTADFARMATKVIETRNEGFLPKVGTGTTATMPGSLLSVEPWSARGVDQWRFAPLVLKAIKNPNHKGVKISELDGSDYQKINKLLNENAPDKKQRELWWSQRDLANLFNSGDVDE